jgi:hypothetical protein
MIKTSIKNRLIVHQLNFVVEKTVESEILKEIIEYCVAEQVLECFSVMGCVNGEIHARMDITVTYESGAAVFSVTGNVKNQMFSSNSNNDWIKGENEMEKANCPVWAQAIEWFTQLCRQENLPLNWCVRFSERTGEMNRKFGLSPMTYIDKTNDSNRSLLPNSVLSNLVMSMGFSSEKFGDSNYA